MRQWSGERPPRRLMPSQRTCCALVALLLQTQFFTVGTAAESLPAPPAESRTAAATSGLAAALERRGDLTLRNSSLEGALFTISELWGINIVVGDVKGTVNGVFKDAPLREILDSILLSNGYSYRPVGQSLVVSTLAELGRINPYFESATIPVRSADIDEIVEGASLLTTPQGQIRALKSAGGILVLDFPDRVKMIREFVAAVDGASGGGGLAAGGFRGGQSLEVGQFRTQYISARAAEQALQAVLSKDGRVGVLEKEDRLLVSDYGENLAMVAKVLASLDRPRPQVRITALIYDIGLQDIERFGINWGSGAGSRVHVDGDGTRSRNTAFNIDSIMEVPLQAGTLGSALTFMNLSRHVDITAVAMALQSASDARLLADPFVIVLENDEAIFQSVSEIPFQQLTQTQQGGEIGTTAFKNAGITLRVRPKIAVDGTIEMQVAPEFSRLAGFTPGDNQPIIDLRSATTVLRVANRQTVVIGGLRQRSDVGDFKGVPYLKDMKVVGRLFRSRQADVRESELVVFIMPEIIGYADEPNLRQKMVADTVACRLDQIPLAEGCPPCCRRLPVDAAAIYPPLMLPYDELEMTMDEPRASAANAQSAVAGGRLQRLPTVERGTVATGDPFVVPADLFSAPPSPSTGLPPQHEARFRATGAAAPTEQHSHEGRQPRSQTQGPDRFWR